MYYITDLPLKGNTKLSLEVSQTQLTTMSLASIAAGIRIKGWVGRICVSPGMKLPPCPHSTDIRVSLHSGGRKADLAIQGSL
jgi:hypothetical protein